MGEINSPGSLFATIAHVDGTTSRQCISITKRYRDCEDSPRGLGRFVALDVATMKSSDHSCRNPFCFAKTNLLDLSFPCQSSFLLSCQILEYLYRRDLLKIDAPILPLKHYISAKQEPILKPTTLLLPWLFQGLFQCPETARYNWGSRLVIQ
jgi:hypothetical protein